MPRSMSPREPVTEAEERDEEPREEPAKSDLVSDMLSQQQNETKPILEQVEGV